MGAEWLNNMPVGDGWFPNQPQQPVVEVQFRVGPGLTQNVVEYLYAAIEPVHLGNGTNTNPRVRSWVQTMVGHPKDQAGHIIGKNQGGLGTVDWNIFPQNAHFNMGAYSHYIEPVFYNTAREHGTAKIWFRFVYDEPQEPQEPYRPTRFNYFIKHRNGSFTSNDLINP